MMQSEDLQEPPGEGPENADADALRQYGLPTQFGGPKAKKVTFPHARLHIQSSHFVSVLSIRFPRNLPASHLAAGRSEKQKVHWTSSQ